MVVVATVSTTNKQDTHTHTHTQGLTLWHGVRVHVYGHDSQMGLGGCPKHIPQAKRYSNFLHKLHEAHRQQQGWVAKGREMNGTRSGGLLLLELLRGISHVLG